MINFIKKKKINDYFLPIILIFLISINVVYFFLNLTNNVSINVYGFNELFINYQAGFVRRGLLGELFWHLNENFLIDARVFFSILFLILYLIQIYLLYKVLHNFKKNFFIYVIILFSPVFILFNIYDQNLYYIKDIFIKLSILFHSYIIIEHNIQKKKFEDYLKKLKFFIIPLLIITILIHEYQILFLSVHFLLSLGLSKNKQNISQLLKPYMILIIPFLFVLIFIGDQSQYENLNQILQKFEVSVHPQLGGGFYKAIGGFYKWHFFYFDYFDFLNLLSALFLGLFLFYFMFQFFLEKNIIIINSKYQKNYLIFFIPCLLCFLLALDHGRNISLISTHLLAFFLILKLNLVKLKKLFNQLNKNFLKRYLIYFFIFFYIFMWKLDQMAGFTGSSGQTIFQSSLFAEFVKLIKFLYNFVDIYFFDLPEIKL